MTINESDYNDQIHELVDIRVNTPMKEKTDSGAEEIAGSKDLGEGSSENSDENSKEPAPEYNKGLLNTFKHEKLREISLNEFNISLPEDVTKPSRGEMMDLIMKAQEAKKDEKELSEEEEETGAGNTSGSE